MGMRRRRRRSLLEEEERFNWNHKRARRTDPAVRLFVRLLRFHVPGNEAFPCVPGACVAENVLETILVMNGSEGR